MNKLPTPETDDLDRELHNPRVLQDRYSEMMEHAQNMERERDEARNKMADALQEVDLRNLDFERMKRERDEAREALKDWENAAAHVEADHPDEVHCGCVPVLRKLLTDAQQELADEREAIVGWDNKWRCAVEMAARAEVERDEARKICRELNELVAYGLGQSGEPWSIDAMRQAADAIQKAKGLEESK